MYDSNGEVLVINSMIATILEQKLKIEDMRLEDMMHRNISVIMLIMAKSFFAKAQIFRLSL